MSLFALAERAVVPRLHRRIDLELNDLLPPPPQPPAGVTAALKRLVDFIPAETLVLFWLAVPAVASLKTWWLANKNPNANLDWLPWAMYAALSLLTPVLLLLAYLSERASKNLPPPAVREWPWWKAIASTIAFGVWVFAVPGNPFVTDPALLMAVWVGATLVSILLGFIDPIVVAWFKAKPPPPPPPPPPLLPPLPA